MSKSCGDPTTPAAPVAAADVTGAEGIIALFDRAGRTLKRPKMLMEACGLALRLSLAGPGSRAPGAVNLTSIDGDFDGREWYGRVTRDGKFEPSRKLDVTASAAVLAALVAFGADPAGQAAAYGKRTGVCCFCGIKLSDPRSTKVGYGKTCAGRMDLPW